MAGWSQRVVKSFGTANEAGDGLLSANNPTDRSWPRPPVCPVAAQRTFRAIAPAGAGATAASLDFGLF